MIRSTIRTVHFRPQQTFEFPVAQAKANVKTAGRVSIEPSRRAGPCLRESKLLIPPAAQPATRTQHKQFCPGFFFGVAKEGDRTKSLS